MIQLKSEQPKSAGNKLKLKSDLITLLDVMASSFRNNE